MYEIQAVQAIKRDLKKLDPQVKKEIQEIHFNNIRENPFQSYELGYAFRGLRSYHFDHKGKSYRIVYEIFQEDELVVIIMIGARESFYEKLKNRV